jgi:serine/threonine protein kinase
MVDPICAVCASPHPPDGPCVSLLDARLGRILEGKYEITGVLGSGGMGKVYAARNVRIGRRVAIKFLLPQYAAHPEVLRRFGNEARAAGPLEHENVAAVHDFGEDQGTPFLVMDLLQGEDVASLLRRERPLPVPRAVNIVLQACRGLDVAHRAGIVHRDLKPANLFVTKTAERTDLVKILDFGIAKLRSDSGTTNTATGVAIGTPDYMSPEQARGERTIDIRTDIYSLGVILYELLGGRTPHHGSSYLEIIYSILHNEPTPLETIRPGLPAGLSRVVATAMSFDPAARYATAAALGETLIPFAGGRVPGFRSEPAAISRGGPADETLGTTDSQNPAQGSTSNAPVSPSSRGSRAGARAARKAILWGLIVTGSTLTLAGSAWWIGRQRASAKIAVQGTVLVSSAPPTTGSLDPAPSPAPLVSLPPSEHVVRPDAARPGIPVEGVASASENAPSRRRGIPALPKRREPMAEGSAAHAARAPAASGVPGTVDIARDPNF